ncbi:MAG: Maf family protein [Erysipelotrichaceae bacterium]
MKRIILASESPRRRELMMMMDIPFTTKPSHCEEYFNDQIAISEAIEAIALQKAKVVLENFPQEIIIGADTVVVIDNEVLGKPHEPEVAINMLRRLSGCTHKVITAVSILSPIGNETFHVETEVTFFPLSEEEILRYVNSKEPLDKAGAYGIQGKGAFLVERINGDYYNVMGLPISTLYRKLQKYIDNY